MIFIIDINNEGISIAKLSAFGKKLMNDPDFDKSVIGKLSAKCWGKWSTPMSPEKVLLKIKQ